MRKGAEMSAVEMSHNRAAAGRGSVFARVTATVAAWNDARITRRELNRVQYLARECELEMGVTARLGTWYGMHRPAQRAEEAFSLSSAVAARAAQPAIARAA